MCHISAKIYFVDSEKVMKVSSQALHFTAEDCTGIGKACRVMLLFTEIIQLSRVWDKHDRCGQGCFGIRYFSPYLGLYVWKFWHSTGGIVSWKEWGVSANMLKWSISSIVDSHPRRFMITSSITTAADCPPPRHCGLKDKETMANLLLFGSVNAAYDIMWLSQIDLRRSCTFRNETTFPPKLHPKIS